MGRLSGRICARLAFTLLVACAEADPDDGGGDSGSGDTGSETGASDTETGSEETGTETGGDYYGVCDAYCMVWLECTDAFSDEYACQLSCMANLDNAGFGGLDCIEATQMLMGCIGALGCAELATLDQAGGACEAEDAAVMAACG